MVSLFFYSLVWFKLVCAVCCARAGLVKQHDCGIECSFLSQYVGRGNSICLVCLVSVFMRSGLTVRSWSRLYGPFCPCWSGGVCTVLVWSSWYTWSGLIAFASFCFAHLALVWSRLLCSRQACSRWARSCLVRSGLFWCCPLCFTLESRPVCSGLFVWFVLVQFGLVQASLSYLVCPRWVRQAT